MKVFVQGENSLIPLQSEVTADSVEEALGYTPVNEDDLPDITNDDDSTLYVVDKDGNIITKTDSDGFHAAAMTVNGKNVESGLVTDEDRASWGGSDLDDVISKDDDSTLYIVDGSGNTIAKIDKDGLHTTELELGGSEETKVNVKEHIDNGDIHTSAEEKEAVATHIADTDKHIASGEREKWNDKSFDSITDNPISSDNTDVLYIVDKYNNIIAKFDGNGLHTAGVYIDGESVSELIKKGSTALSAEITRATAAEKANTTAISNEETRARNAESALSSSIATVESIAKGASQAVAYGNYSTMVTALNALPNDTYNVGQNILIGTVDVPDLWVSEIATEHKEYTYTNDATLTAYLAVYHKVQVGYYVLSQLETQKVDLTDYAKSDDLNTHAENDTHITSSERTAWNDHKDSKENPHGVTKEQVGLGNVDNTSDDDKPISKAQQKALDDLSEQIISPNDEWTVTDKDGNIIATIDADGLHTTTVEAESIVLDGEELTPDIFANKCLEYTLSDDGTYYSCTGIGTVTDIDIVIPSEYKGIPVTNINAYAFMNNKTLRSITLSNNITAIGGFAFFGCSALEKINIPNSVTTIGYWTFDSCKSLTVLYIPASVHMSNEAITGCSNLTIFCEVAEKPENWDWSWNYDFRPVYWGVSNPPNVGKAVHALIADEATHATSADSATTASGLSTEFTSYTSVADYDGVGYVGIELTKGKTYAISYLDSTMILNVVRTTIQQTSSATKSGVYCVYIPNDKRIRLRNSDNTNVASFTLYIREL